MFLLSRFLLSGVSETGLLQAAGTAAVSPMRIMLMMVSSLLKVM
jgi:hypothetical protein